MGTTLVEPIPLGVDGTVDTEVHDRTPVRPSRVRTVLMDAVRLLALVWSIPLAIWLVGAPVALTIAFLLWLGRLARHAL